MYFLRPSLLKDIYDIGENNIVVFPNSNFVTNTIYYSGSANNYLTLKENAVIDEDYITNMKNYSESILNVSNDIIIHDLIRKEGPSLMEEIKEEEEEVQDGT